MKEELFLKPEYLKTLKFIVCWENNSFINNGHRTDALGEAFVLGEERCFGYSTYYIKIYIIPVSKAVYFLFPLRESFNNLKVVPQVVWDLVKGYKSKNGVVIRQLDKNIENITGLKLISENDARMAFLFWAVKKVPFDGLTFRLFNRKLDDFISETVKLVDDFDKLYRIYC